jgi:mediator of RNA polymerase II transcription subunit 31
MTAVKAASVSESDLLKIKTLFRDDKSRFQLEIEFVELLANPWYLQRKLACAGSLWLSQQLLNALRVVRCTDLAQARYFDDKNFLNYLEYLQYWSKPEYIKYLR